jgi:hypothetical protein
MAFLLGTGLFSSPLAGPIRFRMSWNRSSSRKVWVVCG